jgi:hypothetical protein
MKFKNASLMVFTASALAIGLSMPVSAATVVDTRDIINPGPGTTYWIPTPAQKTDSPYYRFAGGDWGWQHSAIGGTITSASLNISAFDVDAPSEVDEIYAFNSGTSAFELLGSLIGSNDTFSYTTFNLGASWFDEIAVGLQVMMKIDEKNAGWAVSLAKSVISIDGGTLPDPNPGQQVPVPAAVWLFGSGLAGLMGMGMRKKSKLAA